MVGDASVVSVHRDDCGNAVIHLDNDAGLSIDVGDIEGCSGAVEREGECCRDGIRSEKKDPAVRRGSCRLSRTADAARVEHFDERVERASRARIGEPQS